MKIGGFQRLSLCDYPGVPAAVIFLQGCNLNCTFCHNRDLIPMNSRQPGVALDDIHRYLQKRKKQVDGVVITGGEPTVQAELPDLLDGLRNLEVNIKLDTNGTRPEFLRTLIENELVDYVAMDIKAPWEKYDSLSGAVVDIEAIKRSMELLAASGIAHHFRTTKVDHLLDDDDIASIRREIPVGSSYVIQNYRKVGTRPDSQSR